MDRSLLEAEAGLSGFLERTRLVKNIEKIPGDASTRRYYRILTQGGESLICMVMESFTEHGEQLPFLAVQKHLVKNGILVPRVLDFDATQGFILLEDLGDVTLLRALQTVDEATTEFCWFDRALKAIAEMHARTGPGFGPDLPGFHQRFDVDKLMWEINFTIEHFYQKHLNRSIPDFEMSVIKKGFERICTELQSEHFVFTHRDYHSRNLMVKDQTLYMIDFQDARMGPPQYDVASLLRDSYYQLSETQVSALLDRYIHHRNTLHPHSILDRNQFVRNFDLMSVQRNFKAIGSFASFLNRRGNPAYLKFIGNTFENIRRNLLKYPEFKELREVLYHYYYF